MTPASTIVALSTPMGTGGVAVIRLSGPQAWSFAGKLLQQDTMSWIPGKIVVGWLHQLDTTAVMDEVVVLPFKAPHSYTGEDVIELQTHGGVGIVNWVLESCLSLGATPAQAGEYTRRAVENGRLDLAQAESVLDLIHAEGEAMVRLAAHNLKHRRVSAMIDQLLADITPIQADIVASVDFPDEVDEPDRLPLSQSLRSIITTLNATVQLQQQRQWIRDGLEIPLVGLPNAGKSSLFNQLLQADRAIVTDIAGTTRDTIRESLMIEGVKVMLVDTAGLRDDHATDDPIERMGVARSLDSMTHASLIIYVLDATQQPLLSDNDRQVMATLLAQTESQQRVLVLNKSDACPLPPSLESLQNELSHAGFASLFDAIIPASAQTAQGLPDLMAWIAQQIRQQEHHQAVDMLLSQRQLATMTLVLSALEEAQASLANAHVPLDVVTVPLTQALMALQGLLGLDTTEQVLDSVFARFCVGK
jgi:tRNA modification GTPase